MRTFEAFQQSKRSNWMIGLNFIIFVWLWRKRSKFTFTKNLKIFTKLFAAYQDIRIRLEAARISVYWVRQTRWKSTLGQKFRVRNRDFGRQCRAAFLFRPGTRATCPRQTQRSSTRSVLVRAKRFPRDDSENDIWSDELRGPSCATFSNCNDLKQLANLRVRWTCTLLQGGRNKILELSEHFWTKISSYKVGINRVALLHSRLRATFWTVWTRLP